MNAEKLLNIHVNPDNVEGNNPSTTVHKLVQTLNNLQVSAEK